MRLLRAIGDFFSDLIMGDPVAIVIAGFFLLLALAVAAIWIADLRRKKREKMNKKTSAKEKPKFLNPPKR